MTRKELKNLALKIAKIERRIKKSTSNSEQQNFENELIKIIKNLSFEDLIELDEIIQTKYKYILDK